MECLGSVLYIYNPSFFILVNGSSVGFFNSSRGLKQVDHLSPLIFIFVMEALNKMILALVSDGFLYGFSARNGEYSPIDISHFHFANNTLILCVVNFGHIQFLRARHYFEAILGFKANLLKFELILAGVVPNAVHLTCLLRFKVSSLPMKYLSLPLGSSITPRPQAQAQAHREAHREAQQLRKTGSFWQRGSSSFPSPFSLTPNNFFLPQIFLPHFLSSLILPILYIHFSLSLHAPSHVISHSCSQPSASLSFLHVIYTN